MQCPSPCHPVRDDSVLPTHRHGSKLADVPNFASRTSSAALDALAPPPPPVPYVDVCFVSKPIFLPPSLAQSSPPPSPVLALQRPSSHAQWWSMACSTTHVPWASMMRSSGAHSMLHWKCSSPRSPSCLNWQAPLRMHWSVFLASRIWHLSPPGRVLNMPPAPCRFPRTQKCARTHPPLSTTCPIRKRKVLSRRCLTQLPFAPSRTQLLALLLRAHPLPHL
jgi:hypothetical protein